VVLNLVPPEHVAAVRATVDEAAAAAGRTPPLVSVWVSVAVDPGEEGRRQLASQLTIYLAPPGYAEMFSSLGFSELVERANARPCTRSCPSGQAAPERSARHIVCIGIAI